MGIGAESSPNWGGFALLTGAATAVSVVLTLTEAGATTLAFATGGASLLTLVLAGAAARQRRLVEAKLSADLTAVSERLLRLERQTFAPPGPEPRTAALVSGVAADLEILSRLTTEMAETLRSHDRDLRELKAPRPLRDEPDPRQQDEAREASCGPAGLATREDFARAASAIISKLTSGPAPQAAAPAVSRTPPALTSAAASAVDDGGAVAAFEAGRIELHLQPVVTLPQRHARLYETVLRLRGEDGEPLAEEDALAALDRHGLVPELDLAALPRILAVAAHLGSRGQSIGVSWRVAAATLRSARFRERAFAALAASPEAARRIVLQVGAGDLIQGAEAEPALDHFRGLGLALLLASPAELRRPWPRLVAQNVSFVKVSANLLLDPARRQDAADALFGARSAGIGLIAAGVESEATVPDLLDFNVPLAQGPALGLPRPVRAEVLAGSPLPTSPGAAGAALVPRSPGDKVSERAVSFRDVLRRAG